MAPKSSLSTIDILNQIMETWEMPGSPYTSQYTFGEVREEMLRPREAARKVRLFALWSLVERDIAKQSSRFGYGDIAEDRSPPLKAICDAGPKVPGGTALVTKQREYAGCAVTRDAG
jgi:hypothetical protein